MMASYLDKAQVNTAITDNTKLDLGHQHITTSDFMQLNMSYLHEMVPGEKIDVNMESFARLNPMPVPTFGRASMRHRAYFVPFRTIFRGWNDFITDSVHVFSDGSNLTRILQTCPTVDMANLCRAFTSSIGDDPAGAGMLYQVSGAEGDVQVVDGTDGIYYNYTVRGRQCVKLLEQMGYKLDYSVKEGEVVLSAMPLLALVKIYCDWMFPQQYSNISAYDRLLAMCNLDINLGAITLTSDNVRLILDVCSYVQYDSDYFVSAWDTPNQPNPGNHSDFKLVNIDSVDTMRGLLNVSGDMMYQENGYVTNNSGATTVSNRLGGANAPFISPVVATQTSSGTGYVGVTPISEYLLHSLHALTDYMKRHQLAGSRAFDRYLARFGKALPAEKMNRSVYLGAGVQNIQIGDIMSTADTEGAQLGTFAGKGLSYGNSHFDFQTDEFGYFVIVTSIVPASGYFQGIDRQVMRTSKLDFWTPEFDSLGSQPITAAELYIPQYPQDMMATPATTSAYKQIFGFAPRYADYKIAHDQLTGNFRLLSLNGGTPWLNAADSWHLMRTFNGTTDFQGNYENVVHSPDFISGKADFSQFKRVFYDDEATAPDNFTVIHNFEIASYVPMKPLYDTYEFEDKGKKVTLDVNGVKHN